MSRSWQWKRVPGPKGSDSEVPPKANLLRWDFWQLLLNLPALEARAEYLLLPHRLLFSFLDRLILKPDAKSMNSVEHPVCGSYSATYAMSRSWQRKRVPGSSDSEVPPKANLLRWDFRQLLAFAHLKQMPGTCSCHTVLCSTSFPAVSETEPKANEIR